MCHVANGNNITDCLSRLCENVPNNNNNGTELHKYVKFVARTSSLTTLRTKEIEQGTANNVTLQNVLHYVTTNDWSQLLYKLYMPVRNQLTNIGYILLRGTRAVRRYQVDLGKTFQSIY